MQVEEDLKLQLAKQDLDLAASGAQQQERKAELQALGAELEQANAEQASLQQELKDLGTAAQVRIWSLSVLHCRCLCAEEQQNGGSRASHSHQLGRLMPIGSIPLDACSRVLCHLWQCGAPCRTVE